jgi:hypothetical protein
VIFGVGGVVAGIRNPKEITAARSLCIAVFGIIVLSNMGIKSPLE